MPHEVATPIAGDPLDAASASVLAAAAELGAMVHRLVEREGGVTLLQYRVLGVLAAARAPVEPRELARLLGVGSGHLTAVLDGLERGGLLTRERHSADARRRLLALTPEGRRRLRWLRRVIGAAERRVLEHALTAGEREVLVGLLTRLRGAVGELSAPPGRGGP